MLIHVLGSSAGGGLPQFNCNCDNCRGYREGKPTIRRRTQSSITLSENGTDWVLFNTSPDILEQLHNTPFLHPRAKRETPIRAIVFIDAQIDHTTGLLMLREGCPHDVYCTREVHEELSTSFPLFTMLRHWDGGGVRPHTVPTDGSSFTIPAMPGCTFTAVPLISNAPPYSKYRDRPRPGDNIGVLVRNESNGKSLFYLPGFGEPEEHVIAQMRDADILLVDGTLWRDDEMIRYGFSTKKGRDMGHLPLSGDDGLIALLETMPKPRKVLIHINNTNPVLDESTPEFAILREHGIEVSYDGMQITL